MSVRRPSLHWIYENACICKWNTRKIPGKFDRNGALSLLVDPRKASDKYRFRCECEQNQERIQDRQLENGTFYIQRSVFWEPVPERSYYCSASGDSEYAFEVIKLSPLLKVDTVEWN